MLIRRRFLMAAAAAASPLAHAQPAQTTLVVPFSAGSLMDILARRYATAAAEIDGATWVVDNQPGGSGVVAARQVMRRAADGRTLLWGYSGLLCNTPLLADPPLGFDPAVEFTPVGIFASTPFVLFCGPDLPAHDLRELQAHARAQAAPLTFAGGDVGGANHVVGEALFQRLGVRATLIPYRNNQQAIADVAEGRVQLGVFSWNSVAALAKSGKVRALSLLADEPLRVDPLLPTVRNQGFGDFDLAGWFGLFAPAGTPPAVLAAHAQTLHATVQGRQYADVLADAGQLVRVRDSAQSRAFVASEIRRYRALLQSLKLIRG